MIKEEKVDSRLVELASRSDGRRGLYCISMHMSWPGFHFGDGRIEIPLSGIPGKIKPESIKIDGRAPGEWLKNYHAAAEKLWFEQYIPNEINFKAEDECKREKNIVLHITLCHFKV